MALFEHRTTFSCSPQGLFDFLTRPENVIKVSDPDLGLKFVSPPDVLSHGVELEFQIVSFGQIHTLKHKIVDFQNPTLVIEEQLEGPMSAWRHIHRYEADENGCAKLDRVEFDPPGGMIGFFLTEDKVIDQLEEGMYVREERINELIERGVIS